MPGTFDAVASSGPLVMLSPEELPRAGLLGLAQDLQRDALTQDDLQTWAVLLLGVTVEFTTVYSPQVGRGQAAH